MMTFYLLESKKPTKKYSILTPQGKTINFGAKGYSDYTIHHDKKRKDNYIARHELREDWSDPNSAGFWSRWLLWNKPSLLLSIRDVMKKFNIKIIINDE